MKIVLAIIVGLSIGWVLSQALKQFGL
jgi:hypothetical protein